ncbi:MAG: O-antigen ligase family protein [Gaiellaceae bacterium]
MPAIRDLPLAASLLLVGVALFFGGGAADGSLPWLGGGALVVLVPLLFFRGVPRGWRSIVPLAVLAGWLAITIEWSSLPDRSWDYADRALVYALFAALGLWLAGRTRALALGLAALLGAVAVWSLAGKVFPVLYDYGPPGVARLRAPVGLWNQLALLGDFALPLGLWRRRLSGTLLAYGWIVALLLTYSRGGLAVAVIVVAAWLVWTDERLESAVTLVAAAVPAAVVVGVAFLLPGVTSDGRSIGTRWHDGLIFGAVLVAGAVAAGALERLRRPRITPARRRALLSLVGLALVAAIVVGALKAGSFTSSSQVANSKGRFTQGGSNFRWVWWQQAWEGWQPNRIQGTGAGTFKLTNLQHRTSYLDTTIEPHDLPLQFLSEAGIVGLALLALGCASLLRLPWRRRGHELALALVLPAYLLHSLVDVDWDFLAVSAPAFLVAGALAGGAAVRRVSPFAVLAAAGAAALAFGALLLPWLGNRWADDALGAPPAQAVRLANRAESVDRLLVEPLWAKAGAAIQRGRPQQAFDYYAAAVSRQPKNPQTWLSAGEYAYSNDCYHLAYTYLERYTELDPYALPSEGGDDYNRARNLIDAGVGKC